MAPHRDALGPLLTISQEELTLPARRREDRDVLVLRIEIETQRREVARLMAIVGRGGNALTDPQGPTAGEPDPTKLLLSARDLRNMLGVTPGTLYRWMSENKFPQQIHVGSLARWKRSDVDAWI